MERMNNLSDLKVSHQDETAKVAVHRIDRLSSFGRREKTWCCHGFLGRLPRERKFGCRREGFPGPSNTVARTIPTWRFVVQLIAVAAYVAADPRSGNRMRAAPIRKYVNECLMRLPLNFEDEVFTSRYPHNY